MQAWHDGVYCCWNSAFTLPLLLLQELKVHGVQFIVAPYEADAQMAYLARRGDVQLVITEDSDLLAYGCPRCGKHAE
jgi:5'-3' exonuclease